MKFQGFNWESWRRDWYTDLATKAADLSHSGITAVWLPPPTESVAPQGFPSASSFQLDLILVLFLSNALHLMLQLQGKYCIHCSSNTS